MRRIKKDDEVMVIAGKDKGKTGQVKQVIAENQRVVVEGINLVKKHTKPNPQRGIEGGIVTKEASIHVSNVMLVNPVTNKPDRVGFKVTEDGKKVRYFKSNNETLGA